MRQRRHRLVGVGARRLVGIAQEGHEPRVVGLVDPARGSGVDAGGEVDTVGHGEIAEGLVERAVERIGQRQDEAPDERLPGELVLVVRELRPIRSRQPRDGDDRVRLLARGGAAAADEGSDQADVLGKDDERVRGRARIRGKEVARDVVDARLDEGGAAREGGVHQRRHLVAVRLVGDGVGEPLLVADGEDADGSTRGRHGDRGEHQRREETPHAAEPNARHRARASLFRHAAAVPRLLPG